MNTLPTCRLAMALLAAFASAGAVQAAQKTTSKCNVTGPGGNLAVHTAGQPAVMLNDISVTVNNATAVNKLALVQLTADAGIDTDSELRVAFNIDGAAGAYLGPQNFANHSDFWQTRSTVAQVTIPPGRHTIQATFWAQGAAGKTAIIDDRCMVVTF